MLAICESNALWIYMGFSAIERLIQNLQDRMAFSCPDQSRKMDNNYNNIENNENNGI